MVGRPAVNRKIKVRILEREPISDGGEYMNGEDMPDDPGETGGECIDIPITEDNGQGFEDCGQSDDSPYPCEVND